METTKKPDGYDPILLTKTTEKVVIRGNKRKYANLARNLRFYGGTTSATEVGCNLRCKFCFSDKPVRRPHSTGRFYTPQQVFNALQRSDTGRGLSAGLAIVLLAIIIDRITHAWTKKQRQALGLDTS